MKKIKNVIIGSIFSVGLLLTITGCSTIYISNGKDKPAPVKSNPVVEKNKIIHYHVFMSYNEYKREQMFQQIYNADHRKQRGRTAPNRALKNEQPKDLIINWFYIKPEFKEQNCKKPMKPQGPIRKPEHKNPKDKNIDGVMISKK